MELLDSRNPVLEIEDIKCARDGKVIVSDISFSVKAGEIVFVRGPSGSGKSLLLKAIANLERHEGVIRLKGLTPKTVGYANWRAEVGYVGDPPNNLRLTPSQALFEYQKFKAQQARSSAASTAAQQQWDLPSLVHSLGLRQEVLNQNWTELSSGERRRVCLAIALALKPTVLLADEPTEQLDVDTVFRAEDTIRAFAEELNAAVIWISHRPDQIQRIGGRVLDITTGCITNVAPKRANAPSTSSSPELDSIWKSPSPPPGSLTELLNASSPVA